MSLQFAGIRVTRFAVVRLKRSFLFISGTCLALIIVGNEPTCSYMCDIYLGNIRSLSITRLELVSRKSSKYYMINCKESS